MQSAAAAFDLAVRAALLQSGVYDVVILDEINFALHLYLLTVSAVL